MFDHRIFRALYLAAALCMPPLTANAERVTVSLNGEWQIEDGVDADRMPEVFTHRVPVPGLAHSSTPAFPDVDQFQSKELLLNLTGRGRFSKSEFEALGDARGIAHQDRNYFWYRKAFRAPTTHKTAVLKVSKAQFGIAVYLNGQKLGEHRPCFTAAYFDASRAIRWGGENQLTIRVGAHPGVLPPTAFCGADFEKNRWTPGLYDDVSLAAFDGTGITVVQVAPRIDSSQILVQSELRNYSAVTETTTLTQRVREWKSGALVAVSTPLRVRLAAGETRSIRQIIAVANARLWSPEHPFLYRVETSATGDSISTRFGMREFRFDTVSQRAYLNGRPYFLRGSNIALHRFFEDPASGTLPWNDAWLKKLLGEIPKRMHWNSFRFSIGPVPDRWLEVADEQGLIIQNEYMVWVGDRPVTHPEDEFPDPKDLITEYGEWMRDNWNHPSVAIWDASNESLYPALATTVIPAVRPLDLSHRPWENSYNPPSDSNDPVEDHPYLWVDNAISGTWKFHLSDLENMQGLAAVENTMKTGHAMILNEYGWLWLNRDGSPTLLTEKLYPMLVGTDASSEQRFAMQAYLLAAETEFWRAYRRYAAVLHFAYLTAGLPEGFTSDHFVDVEKLILEPHFADFVGQAFRPLGVFLNFFRSTLAVGTKKSFTVMLVNDAALSKSGTLSLEYLDDKGATATRTEVAFHLLAMGADSYSMTIAAPLRAGDYTLQAKATAVNDPSDSTLSRRWVAITP
jgi:beta-galactosidase